MRYHAPLRLAALIAAVCLPFTSTLAELKAIDDDSLSAVTGREGLTIDIDMGVEIGEFMYKDAGSIVMQGIRVGGMDRTGGDGGEVGTKFNAQDGIVADIQDPTGFSATDGYGGTTGLNNIRIKVDISGDGSEIGNNGVIYNFNPLDPLNPTPVGIPDNFFRWAWGTVTATGGVGGAVACGNNSNCGFIAGDGDLFIHAEAADYTATDRVVAGGGAAITIADFGMEMDRFALKDSGYIAGDDINNINGTAGVSQETTIISDLRMEGYFGGFDMLIENNGNGFGEYDEFGAFTETGIGDAASKIKINSFFEITEMEYDFDIVGIRYEKMRVHNKRGNQRMFDFLTQDTFANEHSSPLVATSQGFAQSNTHIYAVKDNVLHLGSAAGANGSNNREDYVDGIVLESRFRGDMDLEHLSFGDTGASVGEQYWTDMDINTVMTISAH